MDWTSLELRAHQHELDIYVVVLQLNDQTINEIRARSLPLANNAEIAYTTAARDNSDELT